VDQPAAAVDTAFDEFVLDAERRLRRAFIAGYGPERAAEATAEALAWAWEHRERLATMENPVGYLYRVGQSRTRPRRRPVLPAPVALGLPDVEPGLIEELGRLPERQRVAVWLVHACEWTHREVGEALGISTSAVSTHVARGTERLRTRLEGGTHV
jgi:DNA-directed RNA polymerase specialized sigma24 family protein